MPFDPHRPSSSPLLPLSRGALPAVRARTGAREPGFSREDRDAHDRALIRRAREEGTPEAQEAAVAAFMPLVRSLARRYQRGEEPLDDLEQVASIGLLKALKGFDLERGTAFASFAVPTIVGELRRHFRDRGWTIRVPRDLQELSLRVVRTEEALTSELGRPPTVGRLAEEVGTTIERVVEAREALYAMRPTSLDRPARTGGEDEGDGDTIGDRFGRTDLEYDRVEDGVVLDRLLRHLPPRERRVLELRFRRDLTQAEIGEEIGISQMHVSRLLRRAMGELQALAAAGADDGGRTRPELVVAARAEETSPGPALLQD